MNDNRIHFRNLDSELQTLLAKPDDLEESAASKLLNELKKDKADRTELSSYFNKDIDKVTTSLIDKDVINDNDKKYRSRKDAISYNDLDGDLKGKIDNIQPPAKDLSSDIDSLGIQVKSNTDNISSLSSSVTDVQNNFASIKGDITSAVQKADNNESQITSIWSKISQIEGTSGSTIERSQLSADVQQDLNKINSLNTRMTSMKSDMDTYRNTSVTESSAETGKFAVIKNGNTITTDDILKIIYPAISSDKLTEYQKNKYSYILDKESGALYKYNDDDPDNAKYDIINKVETKEENSTAEDGKTDTDTPASKDNDSNTSSDDNTSNNTPSDDSTSSSTETTTEDNTSPATSSENTSDGKSGGNTDNPTSDDNTSTNVPSDDKPGNESGENTDSGASIKETYSPWYTSDDMRNRLVYMFEDGLYFNGMKLVMTMQVTEDKPSEDSGNTKA